MKICLRPLGFLKILHKPQSDFVTANTVIIYIYIYIYMCVCVCVCVCVIVCVCRGDVKSTVHSKRRNVDFKSERAELTLIN